MNARPMLMLAPLSGRLVSLAEVPDPVFSQRMVGDGIAIDPVDGVLRAPCEGRITQVHPSNHAVTLQTVSGVEVLMHVGLDTVNLGGKGFSSKVTEGAKVVAGTPLIEFDVDEVACNAKSLLTLVVITTMDMVDSLVPSSGNVYVGNDPIFSFTLRNGQSDLVETSGPVVRSEPISIPNPTGLHARPAAVLANCAKRFRSDIRLHLGEKQANAKSVTSIMTLDVRYSSKVEVVASGVDAAEAVIRLSELLEKGAGDQGCKQVRPPVEQPVEKVLLENSGLLCGVPASPGLAVGCVYQVRPQRVKVNEDSGRPEDEKKLFSSAISKARDQVLELQKQFENSSQPSRAAIFAAHLELLDDPDLIEQAIQLINAGASAGVAWREAFESHAASLNNLQNEILAQRANDVCDIGGRVLQILAGVEPAKAAFPPNTILVAEDLTPSETASLDRNQVKGFCTRRGGATSHVAILARSLGIPAIAGLPKRVLEVQDGTMVILDGGAGELRLKPSPDELDSARARQETAETKRVEELALAGKLAVTADGRRIEVAANIEGVHEAALVETNGGEGIGLLRSEFLFMERGSAPTEEEQFETYQAIARSIDSELPIVVRTLDVGGDKPLPYMPIAQEENPFLGERGIRISLDRPEILRSQLRAILRASSFGKLRVMFPMVATLSELRRAKAILGEEANALNVAPIPVGIMIEVPAAALMATQFAKEADFFSIGTNDLTQYTLAMDRGHSKLASQLDSLSPAVLRLIKLSVNGARSHDRMVGVCGGIASDLHAIPILIGLGVDELSVSLPAIPAVKARIRSLSFNDCGDLAHQALGCDSAADVRALVNNIFPI